jgi:hypothetical protein
MIAVDTNTLVYAHRADSEWHKVAPAPRFGTTDKAIGYFALSE